MKGAEEKKPHPHTIMDKDKEHSIMRDKNMGMHKESMDILLRKV